MWIIFNFVQSLTSASWLLLFHWLNLHEQGFSDGCCHFLKSLESCDHDALTSHQLLGHHRSHWKILPQYLIPLIFQVTEIKLGKLKGAKIQCLLTDGSNSSFISSLSISDSSWLNADILAKKKFLFWVLEQTCLLGATS